MSGRLRQETLDRALDYGQRILTLADSLGRKRCPARLVGQLIGSGTSVGANLFEAHEAMSKADFVRCLAIVAKEASETGYWLQLIARMKYVEPQRLDPLAAETDELKAIAKTLIARCRRKPSS